MTLAANILISGPPGIGKTTLIRNICNAVGDLRMVGFYTEEIRDGGERQGFELVGLNGVREVLSHADIHSPFRVGKYGVDVDSLDRFIQALTFRESATDLIIVDEIGKMECFSTVFRHFVRNALSTEIPVVASVAQRGGGFITEVKARWDVSLVTMDWDNRDHLLPQILGQLP